MGRPASGRCGGVAGMGCSLRGGAAGGEGGLEADEVVDVEDGRVGGVVAVGVGVAGGEAGLEADEIVDVEEGNLARGVVAVGVAGNGAGVAEEDEGEVEGLRVVGAVWW